MFTPDHVYYYALKSHARSRVVASLNNKVKSNGDRTAWDKLVLGSINKEALEYSRLHWPKFYGPDTHEGFIQSWERLYYRFCPRPAYFDLAIWQTVEGDMVLQGMALGKPTRSKETLYVNWIERSFAPTYFRGGILLPILACAEEYAKLLGSKRVVVKDPVDPTAFEPYGYGWHEVASLGNCLAKEI